MAEQLDLCEKHFVGSYTGEDASECVVCSLQSELAERWENLNVQDGVIDGLQEEIAALRESLGLLQIGHDHKATLLASCEIALGERDEKISTLQSELAAAREHNGELQRHLREALEKQRADMRAMWELQEAINSRKADLAAAREELERARKALIKQWELVFARSYSQNPIGRAEARYAREIAQEQG